MYHVSREFITNSWLLFFFLQIFFNIITQYSLFSRNQLVLEMRNFFLLSSINNDRILYCYMEFEKKISRIYNFENRKLEMYTGLIFTSAFITYISVNDESTDPYSIRVLSGWPFFPSAFKPSNIHRTKSRCGTRKFLTTPDVPDIDLFKLHYLPRPIHVAFHIFPYYFIFKTFTVGHYFV